MTDLPNIIQGRSNHAPLDKVEHLVSGALFDKSGLAVVKNSGLARLIQLTHSSPQQTGIS